MGTKNNPGSFDCYAKAANNEPIFTLRAKDPAAPYLVLIWEASRRGDIATVGSLAMIMMKDKKVLALVSHRNEDVPKFMEATRCAASMEHWRKENIE